MQSLAYKYNTRIILLGILFYVIFIVTFSNSYSPVTLLGSATFLSYLSFITFFSTKDDSYFTKPLLASFVFFYSLVIVTLFMLLSYYYEGNTFLFSNVDSRLYEQYSFRMKDMPFGESISYIANYFKFDDWGAFVMMSSLLRIIPDKLFINFCFLIFATISAVKMYSIGIRFMPKKFAFLAAFSFSTASYFLYFCGTLAKEPFFILLIILSFDYFYKFIEQKKQAHLYIFIFYLILLFFFRPVVALFIGVGVGSYYVFKRSSVFMKVFFVIASLIFLNYTSDIFLEAYDSYTMGGEFSQLMEYRAESYSHSYSTSFNFVVNIFSCLFGPFPTFLWSGGADTPRTALYAPSVFYKFCITVFFWLAAFYAFKHKKIILYPMIVFVVVEMISLIIVQAGFELRKALPHYPAFYLVSFWLLSQSQNVRSLNKYARYWLFVVILVVIFWNMR